MSTCSLCVDYELRYQKNKTAVVHACKEESYTRNGKVVTYIGSACDTTVVPSEDETLNRLYPGSIKNEVHFNKLKNTEPITCKKCLKAIEQDISSNRQNLFIVIDKETGEFFNPRRYGCKEWSSNINDARLFKIKPKVAVKLNYYSDGTIMVASVMITKNALGINYLESLSKALPELNLTGYKYNYIKHIKDTKGKDIILEKSKLIADPRFEVRRVTLNVGDLV